MDRRRPYGSGDESDISDDLISELARIMGQENRAPDSGAAATSSLVAERRDSGPSSPMPSAPSAQSRVEPSLDARDPSVSPGSSIDDLEFDFGFGASQSDPEPVPVSEPDPALAPEPAPIFPDSEDPIADLIAVADDEAHHREVSRWDDEDDLPDSFEDAPAGDAPRWDEPAETPAPVASIPESQANGLHWPDSEAGPESTARETDALSDIEALIGDAARVDLEPGPMGARRVRSIYAPDPVPQRREPEFGVDDMSPAERAILAAASATGVSAAAAATAPEPRFAPQPETPPLRDLRNEAPRAETVYEETADPEDEEFVQPAFARFRPRGRSGILLPALLGTALLVVLVAGYVFLFGDRTPEGEAPVLLADGQPARAVPDPANTTGTTAESVVFSDIEGQTANAEDSTLVSRDETDGASGNAVSGLLAPEEGDAEPVSRRVRTVTVRPDGTIVSGDEVEAGASILPVDRPEVPEVPGSVGGQDPIAAAIEAAMAEDAPAPDVALAETDMPADEAAAETPAPVAGGVDVPLPLPRPADLPVTPAVAAAPAEQPLAAPAAPAAGSGTVGAWVQLSSQRTEAEARGGIPELQNRYGTLFGSAQLEVSSVDLGAQGIYYRVRLPQPSIAEANSVCGAILAQGGDCFVIGN